MQITCQILEFCVYLYPDYACSRANVQHRIMRTTGLLLEVYTCMFDLGHNKHMYWL